MAKFSYTAKTADGQTQTGVLEAGDELELARTLRKENLLLVGFSQVGGGFSLNISLPFFNRVSLIDKLMFLRNLEVMVASGIPLPRSLDILSQQTKSGYFKKVLQDISKELVKGKQFSKCLGKYPNVFSDFFCSMVAMGEESGNLDKVLQNLAYQMEKEHKLKAKVKGAMTYPTVILVVMLIIGSLIIIFVLPKLISTFESLGVADKLPPATKALKRIGDSFSQPLEFLKLIAIISLIIYAFRRIIKTPQGKKGMDWLVLRLPVFGDLVKKTNVANIVGSLSTLMNSGLAIVKSLEIIERTTGNYYFKESLQKAAQAVQKGRKLSEALEPYKYLYTNQVVQMMSVGEETGETSAILAKLSQFYEEEVMRTADNLSSIIEPVLMIVIGGAVAFFAVSMLSPMYSIMDAF